MKFRLLVLLTILVFSCPGILAKEYSWSLDLNDLQGLSVHGSVTSATGVEGRSLVLNGDSMLKVKASNELTGGGRGFTLTAWVNPYSLSGQQQMIAAKNRYSLDERQWGVMIDKDNRFRLYVWQGHWETAEASTVPRLGHWHLVGVVVRPTDAELWVNGKLEGRVKLDKPVVQTKAPITFGGVDDNGRIWQNLMGALDQVQLFSQPLDAAQMAAAYQVVPATHSIPAQPEPFALWTGSPIPSDIEQIPFAKGIEHRTIHRPTEDGCKFLHGAAIVQDKGVMYANWANSPVNENGPHETLQGRRSTDGGVTWTESEVIGPGFEGQDRHSHGVLFVHQGEVWTICAKFGVGTVGRRFHGLQAEAFVLDKATDRWKSRGIVMQNCWPYDEPVRMPDGNFITGGQDKDGLPVVAISHGDDLLQWDTVLIPYERRLKPSYAETTVWSEDDRVIAVIRGGAGVAWVSISEDCGRTWSKARPSNLPMPRAKAYLGKLSTGQLYLLSNLQNRDTLVVSVSRPGEQTLSQMWRIRHGESVPPRFPGAAKGKQWSYPYGYEHDGKLYVVYSIGKEECGLSVLPIESLTTVESSISVSE
ncbi:MAG: exo-alpha-sialidase [Rubripirellula sp.]|nr:exo-alpha-sialidase [Rubripirellula sp.]